MHWMLKCFHFFNFFQRHILKAFLASVIYIIPLNFQFVKPFFNFFYFFLLFVFFKVKNGHFKLFKDTSYEVFISYFPHTLYIVSLILSFVKSFFEKNEFFFAFFCFFLNIRLNKSFICTFWMYWGFFYW